MAQGAFTLPVQLDRTGPVPLYYQLKEILLEAIQEGYYSPGQLIPGERELEEMYSVSQITVRRALNDLATDGYILRQPGRGSFVRTPKLPLQHSRLGGFFDALRGQGFEPESRVLELGRLMASGRVKRDLCVDSDRPLFFLRRLIYANGEALVLVVAHFDVPEHVTFTRAELEADSAIVLLEQRYGIALVHAERTIEATLASDEAASLLQTKPGAPMLLVRLCMFDASDRPIGLSESLYRGDRYKHKDLLLR
jgi:GntR family transcriptional regulator